MENIRTANSALTPFFRITLRIWLKVYGAIRNLARPFFDLLVRLLVAQHILRSGLVKWADWDAAIALATYEYPVSWMSPYHAALTGVSIEIVAPILLILGLFTRPAALAILALTLVSQFSYIPTDINLFIIALMGWYVVRGAGGFSLDRGLAAGFGGSAIPLASSIVKIGRFLTDNVADYFLLAARLWLAVTLLIGADVLPNWADATLFPSGSFSPLFSVLAIVLAGLLVIGFAAPIVSILLLVGLTGVQFMGHNSELSIFSMLFSAMFLLFGSGAFSADKLISRWFQSNILYDGKNDVVPDEWPHIVVIGGGFGGLACVAQLKKLPVRITLVDRHNYHLFQPLLYQIATASLSPSDVATPIRGLFRDDRNVRVLLGNVDGVDTKKQIVSFGETKIDYEYLVLATGSSHSYFGKDEWAPFAPGLKRIEDGVAVRAQVLNAFERAEASNDEEERKRLLTFVIVGAGPTGVELAGAIAELAHHGLKDEYREIDPAKARIMLVQSGGAILPAFPAELAEKAASSLEELGVEILLKSRVTDIQEDRVLIGETEIATETVLWAAGVVASPAGAWLDAETDRSGRVVVNPHLKVVGQDNVFAIGDTASSNGWDGQPVPGLAPAAKQAGQYVSRYVRAILSGESEIEPFAYKHQGSLATIGRKSAVADFGRVKLHGALAWWLWGAIHVGFLVGVRNRAAVLVNWIWSYFTLQLGIRLITGDQKGDRSGE